MANRRMFSKSITSSAKFLKLPLESQALYFHLGINADDDGVVEAFVIMRLIEVSEESLRSLEDEGLIIVLNDHLVSYITDWHEHNLIRADRKVDSKYKELLKEVVKDVKIKKATRRIEKSSTLRKDATDNSSLPYSFTYKIRQAFHGKNCPLCDKKMTGNIYKPSIQHNVPISKGGIHELSNISIVCHKCNVSVRDKVTNSLNTKEVSDTWNDIIGQTLDSPKTAQVRLGKVSIGKDNKKENIKEKEKEKTPFSSSGKKTPDHVINFLNKICGTKFKSSTANTKKHINARIKEGFTIDDFKAVIRKKYKEWHGTDMAQYLRPSTLFSPKFESYLNAPEVTKEKEGDDARRVPYFKREREPTPEEIKEMREFGRKQIKKVMEILDNKKEVTPKNTKKKITESVPMTELTPKQIKDRLDLLRRQAESLT